MLKKNAMKHNNLYHVAVLSLVVIMGIYLLCTKASADGYEIAGGGGISLSTPSATEGMLLVAWIKPLSNAFDFRLEPNLEFIETGSGHSMVLAGVSPIFRLSTHGQIVNPFLDLGIGLSAGSMKTLDGYHLGGYFFFSPAAGAGIKFGRSESGLSLFARVVHHSNANLFPANHSLNALHLLMGYRF